MHKATMIGIAALVVCGLLALRAGSGEKAPKREAVVEHDFGTKVVSVRTSSVKPEDKVGFAWGYLAKAQVRRLGDRSFLVGEVSGRNNPYQGAKLWIPLSAVLELGEFDSLEAVERILDKLKSPSGAGLPGSSEM